MVPCIMCIDTPTAHSNYTSIELLWILYNLRGCTVYFGLHCDWVVCCVVALMYLFICSKQEFHCSGPGSYDN